MEQKVERTETVTEQQSLMSQAQNAWQDFGPLLLGLVVFFVILAGGWYLWKNRTQTTNDIAVEEQQLSQGTTENLPSSQFSLNSPTPSVSPKPTASVKPTSSPKVVAMGKGGKELPKTGPETFLIVLPFALLTGGLFLRKFSNKI